MAYNETLVVFDFDWSLVNENSDTWVVKSITPELSDYMNSVYVKGEWTHLMNHIISDKMIAEAGVTLGQLDNALRSIPIFTETIEAVKIAFNAGAKLAILSDANEYFISVILRHLQLETMFTLVATNYGKVVSGDNGKKTLQIIPHQSKAHPHSCSLCPPNLCKGIVLEKWLQELNMDGIVSRVLYIGDGSGDYCPCQHCLGKNDVILCRDGWPLHKMIHSTTTPLPARIEPWNSGDDLLAAFKALFNDNKEL